MVEAAKIVGLCVLSSVIYGICHDQVTARICVEYFTIGHPTVINSTSPTSLGIVWGVLATWWVGGILGLPLAAASRVGSWPKRAARSLVRPVVILMIMTGVCSIAGGVIGHLLARSGWVWLLEPMASRVPADRHVAFLADLWAHLAGYLVGFVGGLVLTIVILVKRRAAARRLAAGADGG